MFRRTAVAFAAATAIAACAGESPDRTPTAPPGATIRPDISVSPETARLEKVARRLALALGNPGFRARLYLRLSASRYAEHKLHLQRTFGPMNQGDVQMIARATGEEPEAIDSAFRAAPPLEIYLPVPEHRARWSGDEQLLVATAAHDNDLPVAFDLQGGRHLLDPTSPPLTPVLAVVPVETDFDTPPASVMACPPEDPTGCEGSGPTPLPGGTATVLAPGLYMTAARFNDDFEGWLKGDPEFEIHIMGQKGLTDSLVKLRCAGEKQPEPYRWDGGTTWSGSVTLFTQAELDAYHTAHPGETVRILALEDDDTACEMKVDKDRWKDFVGTLGPLYNDVTGAIDTGTVNRYIAAGRSIRNFLAAVAGLIKTNDDLIGNAIEDKVAGQYKTGYNWVLKSDGGQTNGWLKLQMQ